jgi:autotransporter-associated beta strand protein
MSNVAKKIGNESHAQGVMMSSLTSHALNRRLRARRGASAAFALSIAAAGFSPLGSPSARADSTWTGTTNTEWNTTSNWSVNPSGQNVLINTDTGNIATITADSAFTPVDIFVGVGSGTSGRLNHVGGTATTGAGNWMFVGCNGGTGVYNLANTATTGGALTGFGQGSGSLTVAGNFYIGGRYFDVGGNGTFNMNTSGTLTAGLVDVFDSNTAGTGTFNLDNGTIHSTGEFWVGAWGTGAGTMNQSGGTVQVDTWLAIGRGNHDGGTGTYNLNGGTINAATNNGFITLGSFGGANGTMNVTGGTANSTRQFYVGEGGTGTLNVSGSGTVNVNGAAGGLSLGVNASGVGTVNLNAGGTIQTTQVSKGAGTGTFNFNGGVLKASADQGSFISGLTHANIKTGGAIIDTNGKNVGVTQAFEHDTTGPASDGGITKNGAGTLTLGGGTSTYTGATVLNGGTLRLASGGPPVAVARYSFDELANGSLAGAAIVANTGSGGTAMNGNVNHADNFLDPTNGGASIVAGHLGKGLALDGFGSSVDVASTIVDQSGGSSWTFSAWINTTTAGSSILSKDDGNASWNSGDSVFYLGTNPISGAGGNLPTAVRNSGGFMQGDPTPVNVADGAWHMVTFVGSGGTKLVYVDGLPTTMTLTDFNNGDTSTLARLGFNIDTLTGVDGAQNFFGAMDELTFFDTSLNAAQVQSLYTNNVVTTGVGSQQYLPVDTALSIPVSGATLDLNNNSQTIGSLAGVAGSAVTLGTGVLTTGGNNSSTTFAGVISGTGGLSKAGTGTLTLSGINTYTGTTTVKAGVLTLTNAARGVVLGTPTVTTSGGADVQGGRLVLDYTGGSSPANQVRATLDAGFDQASKFSTGLIRSSILGTNRTLGWRDTGTTVEIAYTIPGDANLDFVVSFPDLVSLAQNYNGTGKDWAQGDFNYSTIVDFSDLVVLAQNYNQSLSVSEAEILGGEFASDFALAQSLVPEPTSLAVLALGTLAATSRRRRA